MPRYLNRCSARLMRSFQKPWKLTSYTVERTCRRPAPTSTMSWRIQVGNDDVAVQSVPEGRASQMKGKATDANRAGERGDETGGRSDDKEGRRQDKIEKGETGKW